MKSLTGIAAAATVVSAALVVAATIVDLVVTDQIVGVRIASPLDRTLFGVVFCTVGILMLLQIYLWIAMLVVCVERKLFVWGAVVLFGLSWGAAVFYYLRYRDWVSPSIKPTTA